MSRSGYSASIRIKKPDKAIRYAQLMKRAKAYKRSSLRISEDGAEARFEISASDLAALMATVNSAFRDAKVIASTANARIPQKAKRDKNIYK